MSTTTLSRSATRKLESLSYTTPPVCQGQIVDYSYAGVADGDGGGWIVRRREDRNDGSVSYAVATWSDDEGFEPWQTEPTGEFTEVDEELDASLLAAI